MVLNFKRGFLAAMKVCLLLLFASAEARWGPASFKFPHLFATEVNLTDAEQVFARASAEWSLVEFYAPWCPHCQVRPRLMSCGRNLRVARPTLPCRRRYLVWHMPSLLCRWPHGALVLTRPRILPVLSREVIVSLSPLHRLPSSLQYHTQQHPVSSPTLPLTPPHVPHIPCPQHATHNTPHEPPLPPYDPSLLRPALRSAV